MCHGRVYHMKNHQFTTCICIKILKRRVSHFWFVGGGALEIGAYLHDTCDHLLCYADGYANDEGDGKP